MVARAGMGGRTTEEWKVAANAYGISLWGVIKIRWNYWWWLQNFVIKNHQSVHYKWVNFRVCKSYLNLKYYKSFKFLRRKDHKGGKSLTKKSSIYYLYTQKYSMCTRVLVSKYSDIWSFWTDFFLHPRDIILKYKRNTQAHGKNFITEIKFLPPTPIPLFRGNYF